MDREKMREYGREHFGVGERSQARSALAGLEEAVTRRLERFDAEDVAGRLAGRDASLFTTDGEARAQIASRLGWLDVPSAMRDEVGDLEDFVAGLHHDGFESVVLVGTGGSSRFARVLARVLRPERGGLDLRIVDTSHPLGILAALEGIDLEASAVLVASKAGATIETSALTRYLRKLRPASAFAAITDAGSDLDRLARDEGWRAVFNPREDVGGRYSALTHFGLVPGAVLGVDVERLLDRAVAMVHACTAQEGAVHNPGLWLGAVLGEAALAGRDKLTFFSSQDVAPFADWLEQLVAESTGKEGCGLVPVVGSRPAPAQDYGPDRLFVYLRHDGTHGRDLDRHVKGLEAAGHPVIHVDLPDEFDLGAEVIRWSVATALAAMILHVNPFDEPDVAATRAHTRSLLARFSAEGGLPEDPPVGSAEGLSVWADAELESAENAVELMRLHLARLRERDHLAVLAYVPEGRETGRVLQDLREHLRRRFHRPATAGYGPRYQHATGQLHKGGADEGLFLLVTHDVGEALEVPDEAYGFETLLGAQALADFQALAEAGRRVLRVHVRETSPVAALARVRTLVGAATR